MSLPKQQQLKSGWLRKQGGMVKTWHRRWFVLKGDYLLYYQKEDDSKAQGSICLPGNRVMELGYNADEPDKYFFDIVPGKDKNRMTTTHESYPLSADSADERKSWIQALRKVMFGALGGGIFGQQLVETMAYEKRHGKRQVPEIVEKCVDFLRKNSLEQEGLFRVAGRVSVVKELREAFDCGENPVLSEEELLDNNSVASLLKMFLRELPQSIIPPDKTYQRAIHIVSREIPADPNAGHAMLADLLATIPHNNYNLLKYLCLFLHEVSLKSENNRMPAMNLATVFVQAVIRPEDEDPALLMGTANNRTQLTCLLIKHPQKLLSRDFSILASLENNTDVSEENKSASLRPRRPAPRPPRPRSDLMGLDFSATEDSDSLKIVSESGEHQTFSVPEDLDKYLTDGPQPSTPCESHSFDGFLQSPRRLGKLLNHGDSIKENDDCNDDVTNSHDAVISDEDLAKMSEDELRSLVKQMSVQMKKQKRRFQNGLRLLKEEHQQKLEETNQLIEAERTATASAVTRIVDLQAKLQEYHLKYDAQ